MTIEVDYEPWEHAFVYASGRVAAFVGDGLGRSGSMRTVLVFDSSSGQQIALGSAPLDGILEWYQTSGLAADDEAAAAMTGAAQGDFSWYEPPPDRPTGEVSLFTPPSISRETIQAKIEEAFNAAGIPTHTDDGHCIYTLEPLDDELLPDPNSDPGQRLTADTRRWGGHNAWNVGSLWTEGMGPALLRLAERTDLSLLTILDRHLDRNHVLHHGRRLGPDWSYDWNGPDEDQEPRPDDEPITFDSSAGGLLPGPIITSPLVDHVIIYDDGTIFTAKATTVGHRSDNLWFDDVLAFEAETDTGDTITLAWLTTPGLAAVLQAPTLPHPSVNDLLLATTAGDLTWLDGRNPLDYLTHPLEPAS